MDSVSSDSAMSLQQERNIVIFGETGVGKSSVVNLLFGSTIAPTSPNVAACTLETTRYSLPIGPIVYHLYDTVGLNEPQLAQKSFLSAIEKAYKLVRTLSDAGGIHLLVFCLRGGRLTTTAQSNYRLFHEFLCRKQVPIVLVITHLEGEVMMDDWWVRNEAELRSFGIRSHGHACVTATQGLENIYAQRYEESRVKVKAMIENSIVGAAFSMERRNWFVRLVRNMRMMVEGWTSSGQSEASMTEKDVVNVLVKRCKLNRNIAVELARRIREYSDADT
ncbi:hypothetical protein HYDPIDRAFT_149292 [Hydnomerulius pinastri MD-312]|nr:hypothetical protein HYDPIDRAFT_149292 [Hydnomerulius pinastri MD-312]